ncbi:MAG: DUF885 domain-containing protein [Actinomycetota bacterium]|nr:MAG: DUF885 domain-containing protein [Actinomycetota bacterium]
MPSPGVPASAVPSPADRAFVELATAAVDDLLARDPVLATDLGDHRFDDWLPDLTPDAAADELVGLDRTLSALDAVDDLALGEANAVDLEILRSRLTARAFALNELARPTWDPLVWNPGTACHQLLVRDFAPLPDRLGSLAARLAAIPNHLQAARETLGTMPRVHVETALVQLDGTLALLSVDVDRALDAAPRSRHVVAPVRDAACEAITAFREWLSAGLADATRSPRLGAQRYAAALWHTLDAELGPDDVLRRAEADLELISAEIEEVAAELTGGRGTDAVRRALAEVAASGPVTDATVLPWCTTALARTTQFVNETQLVTLPELDIDIVEMPEIHRGVAVAYCDAPGPFETDSLAMRFAVAPPPADWDQGRVASFFREYNVHMLHDLTVHEAMPGHVVQLAHARQLRAPTPVRAAFASGPFIEGWAVYAEHLMVDRGFDGDGGRRGALALRLQQLKMALRMTINAILDVRVHSRGMTEDEAMWLMRGRGFQEEGEAAGKWRRAQLTAGQLATYYVGWLGVSEIVHDLRVLHPDWSDRHLHDTVLGQGSPPPRHLRQLVGLP